MAHPQVRYLSDELSSLCDGAARGLASLAPVDRDAAAVQVPRKLHLITVAITKGSASPSLGRGAGREQGLYELEQSGYRTRIRSVSDTPPPAISKTRPLILAAS